MTARLSAVVVNAAVGATFAGGGVVPTASQEVVVPDGERAVGGGRAEVGGEPDRARRPAARRWCRCAWRARRRARSCPPSRPGRARRWATCPRPGRAPPLLAGGQGQPGQRAAGQRRAAAPAPPPAAARRDLTRPAYSPAADAASGGGQVDGAVGDRVEAERRVVGPSRRRTLRVATAVTRPGRPGPRRRRPPRARRRCRRSSRRRRCRPNPSRRYTAAERVRASAVGAGCRLPS